MKTEKENSELTDVQLLQQQYLESLQGMLYDQEVVKDDNEKPGKNKHFYLIAVLLVVVVIGLMMYQNIKQK